MSRGSLTLLRENTLDLWFSFVRQYWERKAVLLTGEQAGVLPRIGPDELFRAVVKCSGDFYRSGHQKVRFYVDGGEIDILEGGNQIVLPRNEDGSFEGYHRRMVSRHKVQDYALIIADWHQFDRALWDRLLLSLEGLAGTVGISRSRIDTQVFLGTYKVTPFGVHKDSRSGFHCPVIGAKTLRFWPAQFAEKTPGLRGAHNYQQFLEESILLTAVVGDVIYWPSDYWHVGESDGSFSVTWGLGYWLGDGIRQLMVETLLKVLDRIESNASAIPPEGVTKAARTLDGVDQIMKDLQRAASSDELRQSVAQSWLQHHSAYGFLKVPPLLEPVDVPGRGVVRSKPAVRILVSQIAPDSICVAAAGRSCVLPWSPSIPAIVDGLNQGDPLAIEDLFAFDEDRAAITLMIKFCLQSGALTLEDVTS